MSEVDAIIVGIIQGLTEFLPISSSGHIEIARYFLNSNLLPAENLLLTIFLHLATALSTIIIFKKDIIDLISGALNFNNNSLSYILKILISIIPAGLIGFFLNDYIKKFFSGNIKLVGLMLFITGVLLFISKFVKKKERKITNLDSLIIGLAQAIAIIPGISRSGATISTSIILGHNKNNAAKFSFLIVIPLIIGAALNDILNGNFSESRIDISILIFGFISALLTGLIACKLMIKIVNDNNLIYFAFYCFALGLICVLI